MMKSLCLAACLAVLTVGQAVANDYIEFPVEPIAQPIPRSYLTGRLVVVPPYHHLFRERVYTTPPVPPYYNVPPYPVIAPY